LSSPYVRGRRSVVARVVHGAVEYPVEAQQAGRLVQLVLVAFVGGNLDECRDDVRQIRTGQDVVPGGETAGRAWP
jgi:hypothetical protein